MSVFAHYTIVWFTINDSILYIVASAYYNRIFSFLKKKLKKGFIISSFKNPHYGDGDNMSVSCVRLTYFGTQRRRTAQIINTHLMFSRMTLQE